MKSRANILIIDDDNDILETAKMFLKHEFSGVELLSSPADIPSVMSRRDIDVYLLDMNFRKGLNDGSEGFYWLSRILEYDPDAVVILITAYGEVDLAVRAMKEGATDFVLKPWKNQKLLATIQSALKLRRSRTRAERLEQTNMALQQDIFSDINFIGESPSILRVKELIRKVGETDANVLVLGENGTGKELVARSLHMHSSRKDKSFIHLDLGSVSPTLFESELFGHVKGAFTDASTNKLGRMEMADQGTLFLDEIGNLPVELQVKLLSVLQQKEITPVGSTQSRSVDFRLISATNQPLPEMIAEGSFREDLLYRINTVEILLPPLRERVGDIPILLDHFLNSFSTKYGKTRRTASPALIEAAQSYHWPGNIRELQFAAERAVILSDDSLVNEAALIISQHSPGSTAYTRIVSLEEKERTYIIEVLDHYDGNVTKAAEALGLTRTAMYRRLHKYNLK